MTKIYDRRRCAWKKSNGSACEEKAMLDTKYCIVHHYISDEFLGIEERQAEDEKHLDWQKEMESEYAAYDYSLKHGHFVPEAKDFPCYVNGFYYRSLREYEETEDAKFLADGGWVEEYDGEWYDRSIPDDIPAGEYYNGYQHPLNLPLANGTTSNYKPYVAPPPPPPKHLKMGHWDVVDEIGHMRYVVVHAKDANYYGVWLSMYKDGDVKTAMKYIREHCPQKVPSRQEGFSFYTTDSYMGYNSAKFSIEKGAESFYKIDKRHRDAADKDWIPPNLREIAYHRMFHLIPAEWNDVVRKWEAGGCKGWHKMVYIPKKTKNEVDVINGVPNAGIVVSSDKKYWPWNKYIEATK
jgi:hypothetical protein